MPETDLDRLRKELAEIDAEIRRAVGRRLSVARRIGESKIAAGLPVRDFSVEKTVLERWREDLAHLDVPAERAEALAEWFIEEALRVQEDLKEAIEPGTSPCDILVVGGFGQMGTWVREFLRTNGHRVGVLDPKTPPSGTAGVTVRTDLERAAQDAAVIVVATPMRAAPTVYRELLKTETEAVIFDILSIKAPLIPWIRRGLDRGFHVTSVHPLFGPSARTLAGRNLLVVDCGDPMANHRAASLFASSSLTISEVSLERHDALMAEVLTLPHAVNLLFAGALSKAGFASGELARASPTSFRRQADLARIVTGENPELSYDIQTLNPASAALVARLEAALTELKAAIAAGDPSAYRRFIETGKKALTNEAGAHRMLARPWSPGLAITSGGRPTDSQLR